MKTPDNFEFVIIKKTFTYGTCSSCNGEGVKRRKFRSMVFVEDCPDCNGEGRIRFSRKEEYPLIKALEELQASKNLPVYVQIEDLNNNQSK